MQILRVLAGFSLGRADIVRRAMSKKKAEEMAKQREIFLHGLTDDNGNIVVDGCIRRGIDEKIANSIYDEIESFASYAFNKSHAAAYSMISYKTAYLKCHYPKEYMSALLTSVLDNQNKLSSYIGECQRLGIMVLPPSVNESDFGFTVSGNNIRYGLLAVKNLGKAFIDQIIRERRLKPFTSLYDFCKRLCGKNMNSRAIESLIKCGAFDGLGANRRQLLAISKTVLEDVEYEARKNQGGQLSFFDLGNDDIKATSEPELPNLKEFSTNELLRMEKEIAGIYLSGHPADDYSLYSKRMSADKIGEIISNETGRYSDGKKVLIIGIISRVKTQLTKSNKLMAFVNVEDKYGVIETVVFPNVYEKSTILLNENTPVIIKGSLNFKENEEPKIICDSIAKAYNNEECKNIPITQSEIKREQRELKNTSTKPVSVQTLYLRIDDLNTDMYNRAKRVTDIFDGRTPVIFYLTASNRKVKAPQNMWVSLNDVMIKELKHQLGDDNVVVK